MKKVVKRQLLVSSILFLFLIFGLIFIYNSSTWALSTIRAYVAGESYYSKGQKDAIFHLLQYNKYQREGDFKKYEEHIKIPLGDQIARKALIADNPDKELARKGFIQGGNPPEDVGALIDFFLMFKDYEKFKITRRYWSSADTLINMLDARAQTMHGQVLNGDTREMEAAKLELELLFLNERLTDLEISFSESLREAARWVNDLLRLITLIATFILVSLALIIFYKTYQNIKKSEQMYGDLFRQTRDSVFITTPDGTLVDINPAGVELLGYDNYDEMEKKFDLTEVFEDEDQLDELWDKLKTEGHVSSHDVTLLKKDESKIYVRITAHADIDQSSGKINTIKGIIRDLTDQWKLQEELSFKSALSSKTFHESMDALFITEDAEGKIVDCNDAAVKLFEANSKEELRGMFRASMRMNISTEGEKQSFKEALLKHSYWSNEIVYVTHKGNEFWGDVRISKLDIDGAPHELVRIVDITERKKSEMLLQAQHNELEKLNLEMNAHMSTARHDLRTPLSSIRQMAEMAKSDAASDKLLKRLDDISKEADECLSTINGFLRYIDEDKVETESEQSEDSDPII